MKKALVSTLSVLLLLSMCIGLSGCGIRIRFAIKDFSINLVDQTLQTDSFSSSFHHNLEVRYTAGENIYDVTVRYLFKCSAGENAGTYYFEEKFDKLGRCDDCTLSKPLPILEKGTYKSFNDSDKRLIVSEGDILDTLGSGTEVTVEIIEGGKRIAQRSATFK